MPSSLKTTPTVRMLIAAAVIAVGLAILAAPQPAAAAKKGTRALVLEQANSPVFKAMKRRIEGLRVSRKPPRSGKRVRHDLLVVDGDELSARKMARRGALKRFSDRGRWVLALDVGSGHHKRALAKHTGFEALAAGRHSSRAFLFRHAIVDGVPRTVMLDSERVAPSGIKRVGKRKRRKSKRGEVNRIADMVESRLGASDDELARIAGATAPQAPSIPDEALKVGYSYQATGSYHPKDGAYECGDSGYQVAEWTMNHNFTVYLDNSVAHPQGDFQVVTYDFSGTFNPVRKGTAFYNMTQECTLGGGKKVPRDRSWWTGLFGIGIAPADTATGGKLTWQANTPNTPNATTTVSSEEGFDVGIATEGAEGSVNASYHVDHGMSYQIPDWGVHSNTSGNSLGWQFSSRSKCDVRDGQDPNKDCFGDDVSIGYPNYPNDLSRGQLAVDTTARWRTKQALDSSTGKLNFLLATPVTLVDLACTNINLNICFPGSGRTVDKLVTGPPNMTVSLNAGDAVPVPIKSVELDPKVANGTNHQQVTGTVTLEEKTPFETKVVVISDRENAVVGTPVTDQITQGTATIKKNDTRGTFTVQTNDNKLAAGGHVTANITAFYAEPFDPVPLRIQRPK